LVPGALAAPILLGVEKADQQQGNGRGEKPQAELAPTVGEPAIGRVHLPINLQSFKKGAIIMRIITLGAWLVAAGASAETLV
jgi:hypothetical protein